MSGTFAFWLVSAMVLAGALSPAVAADRYWSGTGNWDTNNASWGTVSGGSPTATWNNTTPDSAVFEGTPGTVTLTTNITFLHMRFPVGGYTINNNGFILKGNGSTHTVTSTNGNVTIGAINGPGHLEFYGASGCTGTINSAYNNVNVLRFQSGTWIAGGTIWWGYIYINGGTVIVSPGGQLKTDYRWVILNGGTLCYNNTGAVEDQFEIDGGSLDNTSGSAINSSTQDPNQRWNGDFTFIGSNGADSDLNIGAGPVVLYNGNRQVTVQNAATTFTVGGVISDGGSGYGLTKAGAGTLKLTGVNTYSGNTTVSAGTLSLSQAYLDADSTISVAAGATLNLTHAVTNDIAMLFLEGAPAAAGVWGAVGSGAPHTNACITGTGFLNSAGGLNPAGVRYWDGANTGGTGDGSSDGGAGTWSTVVTNWDAGYVDREAWNNTTNDKAIFGTAAGTVDLATDINIGEILIEGIDGYIIGDASETQTLNFGGTNRLITVDGVTATIRAGITGSPDIDFLYVSILTDLFLDPKSESMTIGEIQNDNRRLRLRGVASTTNTVTEIRGWANSPTTYVDGGATWKVGDVDTTAVSVSSGKLVLNGSWITGGSSLTFSGGTLGGTGTIDVAAAAGVTVQGAATLAPGDPVGTLTITNTDCTIDGTLLVEVDSGATPMCGTLAIDPDNAFDISAATLDFNVTSLPADGELVIATHGSGKLTGAFTATNNLPNRWTIEYRDTEIVAFRPPPSGTVFRIF